MARVSMVCCRSRSGETRSTRGGNVPTYETNSCLGDDEQWTNATTSLGHGRLPGQDPRQHGGRASLGSGSVSLGDALNGSRCWPMINVTFTTPTSPTTCYAPLWPQNCGI